MLYTGSGLVEKKNCRVTYNSTRNRDTLFLTAYMVSVYMHVA